MNKLILFLLFVSVIAFAREPKFHYKDCVVVKSGFYRNCEGIVDSVFQSDNEDIYYVDLDSCNGNSTIHSDNFKESQLDFCKK